MWLPIILIVLLTLVVLVFVVLSLLTRLRVYTLPGASVQKIFNHKKYSESTFTFGSHQIFYRESGSVDKPLVLFIHGAPGSGDTYAKYLADQELSSRCHLVSYDRPGYGRTGGEATTLAEQVEAASVLIRKCRGINKAIIVGHSYGGTIAVALALAHPEVVLRLVLLAPALDYVGEKDIWVKRLAQRISFWPFASPLIAKPFKISAKEMFVMPEEMKRREETFPTLQIPMQLFMGTRDFIVPFSNVAYAKKHFDPQYMTATVVSGMTHFIPQKYPQIIEDSLHF